jgi:Flp pilus assembly protein TadD
VVSVHLHRHHRLRVLPGVVAIALGQYARSVSDFSKSIWKHPLYADAHYHRGLAYQQLGRLEDAESDRQKAFDLDPEVDRPTWLRMNCK